MTQQWTMPVWAVVAALALAGLLLLLVAAATRRAARRLDALAVEMAALRAAVATDHRPPALAALEPGVAADPASYVITRLGHAPSPTPVVLAPTLPPGVFADVVLREGVLRSASLLHGLRRALAPEARNRIRFEMRREVKRQRKVRRAETRAALRDFHARQRAEDSAA